MCAWREGGGKWGGGEAKGWFSEMSEKKSKKRLRVAANSNRVLGGRWIRMLCLSVYTRFVLYFFLSPRPSFPAFRKSVRLRARVCVCVTVRLRADAKWHPSSRLWKTATVAPTHKHCSTISYENENDGGDFDEKKKRDKKNTRQKDTNNNRRPHFVAGTTGPITSRWIHKDTDAGNSAHA